MSSEELIGRIASSDLVIGSRDGPTLEGVQREIWPVVKAWKESLGDTLVAIVLFGSRARGEALPDSDWDLLVIAKTLPEKILRRNRFLISLLPRNWRPRVAVLAKTLEEFESSLPPLYLDIALDGVVLYDPSHYIKEKLAHLRWRIAEIGLQRRRKDRDWIWLWRKPPGINWELEWKS